MLSNAYFLAKFRFDTAEKEPTKHLLNSPNFSQFCTWNRDYVRDHLARWSPRDAEGLLVGAAVPVTLR